MALLQVSGSPHVHTEESVKKIMWTVIIALVPTMIFSFLFFGLLAIVLSLGAVFGFFAGFYY